MKDHPEIYFMIVTNEICDVLKTPSGYSLINGRIGALTERGNPLYSDFKMSERRHLKIT